jgi:hypothetical protein
MEIQANDTLPFFDILVMKRAPELAAKCTGNLLILVIISISSENTHIM